MLKRERLVVLECDISRMVAWGFTAVDIFGSKVISMPVVYSRPGRYLRVKDGVTTAWIEYVNLDGVVVAVSHPGLVGDIKHELSLNRSDLPDKEVIELLSKVQLTGFKLDKDLLHRIHLARCRDESRAIYRRSVLWRTRALK